MMLSRARRGTTPTGNPTMFTLKIHANCLPWLHVMFQRKADRGDHVPLLGALRRPQEVPCGERGALPIQEHVPGEPTYNQRVGSSVEVLDFVALLNGDIYRAQTWRAWRRWCKATSPWRRRRRRLRSRRPLTRFLSFLMISSHCIENRIPTILSFHHDPRFNRFK